MAAAVVLAVVGGTAATIAVQAAANRRLDRKNAELKDANSRVEARYELAVEAIKTFHTGVSQDFLLNQDQFKDLRDRLLKSAADFYGKLSALLEREKDVASRRALLASNYELAELTGRVGRTEDALAAHRAVLAAREALAAEPGAAPLRRPTSAGASPPSPLCSNRPGRRPRRWRPTAGRNRCWRARRPPTRGAGRAGGVPGAAGQPAARDGRSGRGAGGLRGGAGRPAALVAARPDDINASVELAAAWTGPASFPAEDPDGRPRRWHHFREGRAVMERAAAAEPGVAAHRSRLAHLMTELGTLLSATGDPSGAEGEYRRALAITEELAADHPAVTQFRRSLSASHNFLGLLLAGTGRPKEAEAELRRALEIAEELAADHPAVTESRSRLAARPLQHRPPAGGYGPADGGGGRVPPGAGDPGEAGRRPPHRHPIPEPPGGQPRQCRPAAVAGGPADGGGGRAPPGAGDLEGPGRRQPEGPRPPQRRGLGPHQPLRHPPPPGPTPRGPRLLRSGHRDPRGAHRGGPEAPAVP